MTGTKSWDKTTGGPSNSRRDVERLKIDKQEKIRLVGNVLPRYVYWVPTNEGKKMPVECLEFDRETEQFNTKAANPFAELPEEIFAEKPQFSYVCNIIDRADGKMKIFDLKRTIYNQIVEFAQNAQYGNPASDDSGYDIIIKKEKTGPLPQNVKYTCMPDRTNSPLKKEEKELEQYDLPTINKRPTYDEQKQWLFKNTTYYATEEGAEFAPESAEDL